MRALKWLFIVIVALIVGVVVGGFFLPDQARVERSIVVSSKPSTVYTALNGFGQFNRWSPWADLDPQTRYTLSGPLIGVGARLAWASDDPNVGAGSQEIIEVVPDERVRMRLIFAGFDSENYSTHQLVPEGEGTRVVWSYDTQFHGNLLGRYFGLMLDGMLGPDYEKGLARFKEVVEGLPQDDLSAHDITLVDVPSRPIAYVAGVTRAEEAEPTLAAAYRSIEAYFAANGLMAAEPPLAITRHFDDATKQWRFEAALVPNRDELPPPADSTVQLGRTYTGPALRVSHRGAAADLDAAYQAMIVFKSVASLQDNGDSWEQYREGVPGASTADATTEVFWPVKLVMAAP
ncbi:MAG TPA: SRPBCC family protein [Solimonas sp.]